MLSGVWRVAPSTPNPPARLTAATTSRQWLNANSGNSMPSVSQRGDFTGEFSALPGNEILGLGGAAAEQILLHFRHQEGARLRLDRRQPILVDQCGLVRHPLRPRFFGNVVVNPLSQLAGVRQIVEALRLAFQQ